MNVHTHWVGGLAAGAVVTPLVPAHAALVVLASAVLAAPLPDLDHPGSTYGRFVPLPGVARIHGQVEPFRPGPFGNSRASFGQVGRRTPWGIGWHRGGMHSLVATALSVVVLGVAAQLVHPGWGGWVALGVTVGMLSHLALDALNSMGQAWLWPFTGHRFRLPWPRIHVGSVGEWAVMALLILGLVLGTHSVWAHGLPGLALSGR